MYMYASIGYSTDPTARPSVFRMLYPENTVAGFLKAIIAGADGVELGVWLTSDGVPVVINDRTTARVAGVDLDVKKSTTRELRMLHLGMGQSIPTLEDVYRAVPEGYRLYVEIKDLDAVEAAYNVASRSGRLRDTVFISFIGDALAKLRSLDPSVRVSLNVESAEGAVRALALHRDLRLYSVNLPVVAPLVVGFDAFREYVTTARGAGLRIVVWDVEGYKYDYSIYRKISDLIDEAIVDDPATVRKYLSQTTK